MNRRRFLQLTAMAGLSSSQHLSATAANDSGETVSFRLDARPASTHIVGPDFPATDVWTFNGSVPGSSIRLKHGET